MDSTLYKVLRRLGLGQAAIRVYMSSLTLGPGTITRLAEHSGLSRPAVYAAIRELEHVQLAMPDSKKMKSFVVASPSVVLEKFHEKQKHNTFTEHGLVSIMPELLAEYHQGAGETKIKVLEGEEQFIQYLFKMLEEGREYEEFFGSAGYFVGLISWKTEQKRILARVKKGIKLRMLCFEDEIAKRLRPDDEKQLREVRYIRDIKTFSSSFHLAGSKAILWQPQRPLGVVIEDEYLVEMFRNMFYALWERSGK